MNKSNQEKLIIAVRNTSKLLVARVFIGWSVVKYWLTSKTVHKEYEDGSGNCFGYSTMISLQKLTNWPTIDLTPISTEIGR